MDDRVNNEQEISDESVTMDEKNQSHKRINIFPIVMILLFIAIPVMLLVDDHEFQNAVAVIYYTLNPDSLDPGETQPTISEDDIEQMKKESEHIFRTIKTDGRVQIAYNTFNNQMYTIVRNRIGRIINFEAMMNPDGSPMFWDQNTQTPVGYEPIDATDSTVTTQEEQN